jgi:hypothetical protein
MGWGDLWSGVEGAMSSGVDSVEQFMGMGDTPAQAQQAVNGTVPLTPGQSGVGMSAESPAQAGLSNQAAGAASNWWEKAVQGMMPTIMGAAMRPHNSPIAPVAPGGHAVQASGGTAMQPFEEVTKMASNNPLANIHQWSNLFG